MSVPKKKGYAALAAELPQDRHTREQEENDEQNRADVMMLVLDQAVSAGDLVLLVDALGLDEELAAVAGNDVVAHPERHRRLRSARIQAGLEDAVLE
jgi:hypothetical protein